METFAEPVAILAVANVLEVMSEALWTWVEIANIEETANAAELRVAIKALEVIVA